MRTIEDRKRISDLACAYSSTVKSYDENVIFVKDVITRFPFSYFSILHGRRFAAFWNDIIEKTRFLGEIYGEKDITRLYYYVNQMTEVARCVTCGKAFTKKIIPTERPDHAFHCNMTCMVNDSAVQEHMKTAKQKNHTTTKDLLEKCKERNYAQYGCDWYFQTNAFTDKMRDMEITWI